MTVLWVVLGGMVGAPLRHLTDRLVQSRHDSTFPWGTFAVNVAGSFLLGVLVVAAVPEAVLAGAGVGFCGALTTYSTFGYETVRLFERGAYRQAVTNVVVSVTAGLGAAYVGASCALAFG